MATRKKTTKKPRATTKTPKASDKERKDRLLQTRITPSLYEQVVERAEALRIPVSNLIRIILEDSPRLVTGVVDEGLNIAEALSSDDGARRQRERGVKTTVAPAPADSGVDDAPVAWQTVAIGRRMQCGDCNRTMHPAEEAHMGLGADGRPLIYACPGCYAATMAAARDDG